MTARHVEKNGKKGTSLEDQMAAQLGGFVPKGQAAQKAVDAAVIAAAPFPTSKGSEPLDLDQLFESPKNPRQDFDEEDIEGLAKSIVKTGGLMVAILARPAAGQNVGTVKQALSAAPLYEIADGARRFRALKLLKKQGHELGERALVDIRPLTDAQLAEAFMTADRRKTLKPLEQARGFKNMLDTGHTPETIASTLGISSGTVHGRLKLLELGKRALKLMDLGTLPSALATPLARYPVELQDEALERMLGDEGYSNRLYFLHDDIAYGASDKDKGLKAAACIEWLQENFTKSLKSPPFDQKADDVLVPKECWPDLPTAGEGAELLENQVVAPACGACPKNSRNMVKEVAGDDPHGGGKAGFCTGLPCYQAKWDATLAALRVKAKETGELKVLTPAQSAKALAQNYRQDKPYAKASEVVHEDPKKRTWGELQANLNKKLDDAEQLRKVVATTEEGKVEMVEKAELLKALAGDGVKWAQKKKAADKPHNYQAQQERERERRDLREVISWELVDAQVKQITTKGVTLPVLRAMVEAADGYRSEPAREAALFELNGTSRRELDNFIEKKATVPDLMALLYRRLVADDVSQTYSGYADEVARLAKEQGIDLKKREAEMLKAKKGETETTEEGDE